MQLIRLTRPSVHQYNGHRIWLFREQGCEMDGQALDLGGILGEAIGTLFNRSPAIVSARQL